MIKPIKIFFLSLLISQSVFANNINIPIICYHNLNPTVKGSMNLRPAVLEEQIQWLKKNGFNIIPLKEAALYLQGKKNNLPPKSIVITADDGWESDYTYLFPIIKKYNIPVTLFIYPSTISNGKHALTWQQLKELQNSGLVDIEGHTYWHPNFKQERKHRSADNYAEFVIHQLAGSKKILEEKLNTKINFLAWPFGIYDPYLEQAAAKAGYVMAFSIDDMSANRSFNAMAQPRYMIVDAHSMKRFMAIANTAIPKD